MTAHELDSHDPLAVHTAAFLPSVEVVSYLDGNSLGRPLTATLGRFDRFVRGAWGSRLIRAWDEEWFESPLAVGDRIGAITLGAAPGQTVVADSTTVLLYKMIRAAVAARPGRTEIVLEGDSFPTDRFVIDGIARECGLTVRLLPADTAGGPTLEQVQEVVGDATAVVILSHVAYRSGYLADMPGITTAIHSRGALVVWDLCHSVGVVPMQLDAWGVDIAVGCSYKYLNGGPGAPAFAYVAHDLQRRITQPIQGWMGAGDVFAMAQDYAPADGMRRFLSGTPPIVGMLPLQDMLDLIETVGVDAIREKSLALTDYALDLVDRLLVPLGVVVATPREHAFRGSHVTIRHSSFKAVNERLWAQGVIPDFRNPDGLRLGLSPLSTTFDEVRIGVEAIARSMPPTGTVLG